MDVFKRRHRGSITIFLSLVLSVVLLLTTALTELARTAVIRAHISMDCNNACVSALAEYNRPLLSRYNIFGMDGAYGGTSFNESKMIKRMKDYMPGMTGGLGSGLGYEEERISLDNYRFLTDNCGEEVYRQAVEYMKKCYGLDIISDYVSLGEESSKYKEGEENLKKVKAKNIGDKKPGIFGSIDTLRTKGTLSLVLGPGMGDSAGSIDTSGRLSARRSDLFKSQGITAKPLTTRLLYDEYILKTFSSYTHKKAGNEKNGDKKGAEAVSGGLNYEVEYIIAGKGDDKSNLAKIADKLVFYREIVNFIFIQTDEVKKAEASLVATGLLAITANPAIIKAGEELILAAWAYAESICDVRTLLKGGKVPLVKTKANWHTRLMDIVSPGTSGVLHTNDGLDYDMYLRILLLLENDADKCVRSMDIMEDSIKRVPYYSNFKMENCIYGFSMHGTFGIKRLLALPGKGAVEYGGSISYEDLSKGS